MWGLAWIEIHIEIAFGWGPSHIWLHTTLEGSWPHHMILEVCCDGLLDTFFWALTTSWSRLLAHVWSGPQYYNCSWQQDESPHFGQYNNTPPVTTGDGHQSFVIHGCNWARWACREGWRSYKAKHHPIIRTVQRSNISSRRDLSSCTPSSSQIIHPSIPFIHRSSSVCENRLCHHDEHQVEGWIFPNTFTIDTLTSVASPSVMSLPLLCPQTLGKGCAQFEYPSSLSYFLPIYHMFWHQNNLLKNSTTHSHASCCHRSHYCNVDFVCFHTVTC